MAPPASEHPALASLLTARPERTGFALRQGLTCALTAIATQLLHTPEPAIAVYVVFFLNKPDRAQSILQNLIFLVVISLVIGLLLLLAMAVLDDPFWRVTAIGLVSFALLFLAAASKLRPLAPTLALIIGFGLDKLGLAPSDGLATRAILDAWQIVAVPVVVSLLVNFTLAPSPRRLLCAGLALRLDAAAEALAQPGAASLARLREVLAEGLGGLPGWLKMLHLERTAPAADLAALAQALPSSTRILLLSEAAARDPAALPVAERASLAATLRQMAAILRRDRYPLEIADGRTQDAASLPPAQAGLCDALWQAVTDFAVPEAPAATAAPAPAAEHGGFFLADAFSNSEHVQFALKTTGAALLCYILYTQLNWSGIHTCFLTCYILALGTAAEAVEKLTLRILGCIAGALLGVSAIILVMPALDSIGALSAIVLLGTLPGAWLAASGERIAYAGFQLSFAFFLCVIQGYHPGFDMEIARDRVIGILIGTLASYLVMTQIAPISVARRIDPAIGALLRRLAALAAAPGGAAGGREAGAALDLLAQLDRDLGLLAYEPAGLRPDAGWIATRRAILAGAVEALAPLLWLEPTGRATAAAQLGRLAAGFDTGAPAAPLPAPLRPLAEALGAPVTAAAHG
jgi:multidrug resistance protein MdtO